MGKLLLQLRKENMQAMKEKDTLKKGVLSLVISAIALAEKEKGETLSEADELVYVQKELKQTKDALASTPSSRQDLIDECNRKIAILESYLPKQLSADEIKDAIFYQPAHTSKYEQALANNYERLLRHGRSNSIPAIKDALKKHQH